MNGRSITYEIFATRFNGEKQMKKILVRVCAFFYGLFTRCKQVASYFVCVFVRLFQCNRFVYLGRNLQKKQLCWRQIVKQDFNLLPTVMAGLAGGRGPR